MSVGWSRITFKQSSLLVRRAVKTTGRVLCDGGCCLLHLVARSSSSSMDAVHRGSLGGLPSSEVTHDTVPASDRQGGGGGEPVSCLGFNLEVFPRQLQFVLLASALLVYFIVYGYMQEWIFSQNGMKPHGWYLTLVQFAFYAVASKLQQRFLVPRCSASGDHHHHQKKQIPMSTYLVLALATLTTMGFSNASLAYLNYPTQVIFKCCKLLPVLVGGILIQGKRYGPMDFAAAALMCAGLVWFILADSKVSPTFHVTGVAMISLALVADAVIGNVQERAMKQHRASNTELIFFSYAIGFLYLLLPMAATGMLYEGAVYFSQDIWTRYSSAALFSLSGYLGMQVVLTFVRTFGALTTVTVTSFRKVLTIVLSFVLFSKPFTMQYVYSGALVLVSIYLSHYAKQFRELDFGRVLAKASFIWRRKSRSEVSGDMCV